MRSADFLRGPRKREEHDGLDRAGARRGLGGVDAVSVVAFAYDIYCNPQKTMECSAQRLPCSMQSLLFRRAYLVAPVGRREAEFLRDAMAALPRKSDSDGLRLVAYASESAADFHAVVMKADPYAGNEDSSCAFSFERNVWKDGQEQFGNALLLARDGYGF